MTMVLCGRKYLLFLFFSLFLASSHATIVAVEVAEARPYFKYGLNRVLLEWNPEEIKEEKCLVPFEDRNSGYFCDAVQFALFFRKKYDAFKESVNESILGLDWQLITELELGSVKNLSGLREKTGFNADFNALLLEDSYSGQFKEDFDSYYANIFFAQSQPSIAPLNFRNSPEETGLYLVSLEADISFNGSYFEFPEEANINFELRKSLEELDEELGTEYRKNAFLSLPFDATIGNGGRDYGTGIDGEGVWINDDVLFSDVSGAIATIETYLGRTFDETASGLVLELESPEGDKTRILQLNKSIPVVLALDFPAGEVQRIYYTLTSVAGNVLHYFFFGERPFLFEWRSGELRKFDYFRMLVPREIQCTGWSDKMLAAVVEFRPEEQGGELFHAVGFLPERIAFSVQCVSDEMRVSMLSYDGNEFGHLRHIEPEPGQWLAGMQSSLVPEEWQGNFSLKGVIGDLNKGLVRVEESEGKLSFSWGREAFEELLSEREGLLEPGESSSKQGGKIEEPEKPQIEIPGWMEEEPAKPHGAVETGIPAGTPSEKVENYIIIEERDSDNDGIPGHRDFCPLKPETFNGYRDEDGCPDRIEEAKEGEKPESPVPAPGKNDVSIRGNKVILFVPLGFSEYEESSFKQLSRERFNNFLEMAELGKSRNKISFLAMDVTDFYGLEACRKIEPEKREFFRIEYLGYASTSIAFEELDGCGNAYLEKKYGYVPEKENLRIVGLINSYRDFWYQSIFFVVFCAGLTEISHSCNSHLVFAGLSNGTAEHELGHTFGLEDQYSGEVYLESVEHLGRIPPNYYPGALQQHFDFSEYDADILYAKYPRGTSQYPLCPDEPELTDCPEFPGSQIDCLGRKLKRTGPSDKRSVMGPIREGIEVGFDCYEKKWIQGQWG